MAKDASDFLVTVQVPAFIRDCLDHSAAPMDGQTLSDNLHNRGINIRYIGVIATMLGKVPQLSYIHTIAASEVLTRAAKHIFVTYMQVIMSKLYQLLNEHHTYYQFYSKYLIKEIFFLRIWI